MKRYIFSFLALSFCSLPLLSTDDVKENCPPDSSLNSVPFPLKTDVIHAITISQGKDTRESEQVREKYVLEGQELTENKLSSLQLPHKKVILKAVFGKKTGMFDNRGGIIVSPLIINFSSLHTLSLNLCSLKDENIKDIGLFSFLRVLSLNANQLTDNSVSYLLPLKGLSSLDLSLNKIGNGIAKIIEMTNLTVLNISSNEGVTDDGVVNFIESNNLQHLIVEGNTITREMSNKLGSVIKKVTYFPGSKVKYTPDY